MHASDILEPPPPPPPPQQFAATAAPQYDMAAAAAAQYGTAAGAPAYGALVFHTSAAQLQDNSQPQAAEEIPPPPPPPAEQMGMHPAAPNYQTQSYPAPQYQDYQAQGYQAQNYQAQNYQAQNYQAQSYHGMAMQQPASAPHHQGYTATAGNVQVRQCPPEVLASLGTDPTRSFGLCKNVTRTGECRYGDVCHFAHSAEEKQAWTEARLQSLNHR